MSSKIADCWGYVWAGGFTAVSEDSARWIASEYPLLHLARIVNGVVCDEHGTPLEAA